MGLSYHRLVKVGDNDDAEVDIAGTADISGFQTELDLSGILVQIIRTFWQLSYCDRELAFDAVVGSVFQIELTGTEEEVHQTVVFAWFEYRFQIERVLPIGLPSMNDSGIIGVLLLDTALLGWVILDLSIGVRRSNRCPHQPSG